MERKIYLCCNKAAYELFEKSWKAQDYVPDKVCENEEGLRYVEFSWNKHLSFDDVFKKEATMSNFDEIYQYLIISVYENDSVEKDGNCYEIPLYVKVEPDLGDLGTLKELSVS